MNEGKMISVLVPYEGQDEKGVDVYWAVKPPEESFEYFPEDGEPRKVEFGTSWRIMGSVAVQVPDKAAVQGLRELLDRIEGELDD